MECVKLRKMAKGLSEVLARVAILGVSAQILLGLFWIVMHFTMFQLFGESLLCCLQLAVAAWAADRFLRVFPGYVQSPVWKKAWMVLAMVTFPIAAACHVAVLPVSLTASLWLVSLSIPLKTQGERKGEGKARFKILWDGPAVRLVKLGLLWLIEALLMPEYVVFGAILLVICAMKEFASSRYVIFIAAAFLWLVPFLSGVTTQGGVLPGICQTSETALSPQDTLKAMEERLKGDWPQTGKDVLKDGICYGLAPVAELVSLAGRGPENHLGENYEMMRIGAPKLTSFYVRYGGYCFLGLVLIGIWLQAGAFWESSKEEKKHLAGKAGFVLALCAVMILYYALRTRGSMDEKNVLSVMELWMAWICGLLLKYVKWNEPAKERRE